MSKQLHRFLFFGLFLSLILLAPSSVYAGEDVPPDPGRIEPPPITGLNTGDTLPEGDTGEVTPSGTLTKLDLAIPEFPGSPGYVEPIPRPAAHHPTIEQSLSVPLRSQDPADVTCGAAALGMALDFAALKDGRTAPSTDQLADELRRSGLLYEEVGTGVEELAYLARNHGYRGSYAFHNWTLDQLKAQLDAGRPPVVALGANGEGQPGHFVTVTGVSADGGFVTYNDPILGEQTLSSTDFLRLWGGQGFSGMVARVQPLSTAHDPMLPWMGLFGTLSMLAVLAGRESTRKELKQTYTSLRKQLSNPLRMGLGGMLSGGTSLRIPVYDWKRVQVGWKRVPKEIPVYETKKVQVGSKSVTRQVPNYTMKRVQVGTRTETYKVKVKRYRTVTYTDHVKDTYKVPVYRTRKYIKRYRYQRVKKTKWVRRGWRYYRKTYYTWKRKPVYGYRKVRVGWKHKTRWKKVTRTRRVPYTAYETRTRQVPVYGLRRVRDGWKTVTYDVPKYEERKVKVGTKIVYDHVPDYKWQKVHTGWRNDPAHDSDPPQKSNTPKTTAEYFKLLDEHYDGTLADSDGDYDCEMELFRNRQANYLAQQAQKKSEEPVLEDMPGFWKDPFGWAQAKLINLGRQNDVVKKYIQQEANAWNAYDTQVNQRLKDGFSSVPGLVKNGGIILKHKALLPALYGVAKTVDTYNKHIKEPIYDTVLNAKWWQEKVEEGSHQMPSGVSLSANSKWDINLFKQEGIVTSSYIPPNLLSLFYMSQEFKMAPKYKVTANPGGILGIDVTSATETLWVTKNFNLFSSLQNGCLSLGFGIKKDGNSFGDDYQVDKHSITPSWRGLTYTYRKEGVNIDSELSNEELEFSMVRTLECDQKTIKTEGILLMTTAAIGLGDLYAGAQAVPAITESIPLLIGLLKQALLGIH